MQKKTLPIIFWEVSVSHQRRAIYDCPFSVLLTVVLPRRNKGRKNIRTELQSYQCQHYFKLGWDQNGSINVKHTIGIFLSVESF